MAIFEEYGRTYRIHCSDYYEERLWARTMDGYDIGHPGNNPAL
jgi:hypothetical protein